MVSLAHDGASTKPLRPSRPRWSSLRRRLLPLPRIPPCRGTNRWISASTNTSDTVTTLAYSMLLSLGFSPNLGLFMLRLHRLVSPEPPPVLL